MGIEFSILQKKIDKLASKLKMDIITSGITLANEIRTHETCGVKDTRYFICTRSAKKFYNKNNRLGAFENAKTFESGRQAMDYATENSLKYCMVQGFDIERAKIVEGSAMEISSIVDCYDERKICPVCKKNAATKLFTSNNKKKSKSLYGPCRECGSEEDKLDVTDFMYGESRLAEAQDLYGRQIVATSRKEEQPDD